MDPLRTLPVSDNGASVRMLKQEINDTMGQLHDLAKWKLIATAALVAAALRLPGASQLSPAWGSPAWLLLLVPYACAYVDLNSYQYMNRITVLAKFLREVQHDSPVLQRYEEFCQGLRAFAPAGTHVFDLGQNASKISSIVLSAVAPALGVMDLRDIGRWPAVFAGIIWLAGLFTVWLAFHWHRQANRQLDAAAV